MDEPPSTEKRRTEVITIRITPEGKQAIVDIAAEENRDFSDMARLLWRRGVEATRNPGGKRASTRQVPPREIHPYPKAERTKK